MPDNHTTATKSAMPRKDQSTEAHDERAEPQDLTLGTLQRQFSAIAGEVGELARLVRGGAKEAVASAVDRVDDARHDTVDRAKELEERAADWMRERPLEAALVSMGVGALLWSLLRRS